MSTAICMALHRLLVGFSLGVVLGFVDLVAQSVAGRCGERIKSETSEQRTSIER